MASAERNDDAPNSAPLGAMGSLLRRLDMPPCTDGGSISELKDYIHCISDKLRKLSEVQDPPLTVNYWMKHARELSYDIEAYLDNLEAQTEDNLNDSDAKEENDPDDSYNKTKGCIDNSDVETEYSVDDSDAEIADNPDDSDANMEDCIHDSDDEKEETVNNSDSSMQDSICSSDYKISGFRSRAKGMMDRYERFSLDSVLSCPTAATTIVFPRPSTDVVLLGMDNQIMEFIIKFLQPKDQNDNELKIISILGDEGIGKSSLIQEIWRESFKEEKWRELKSEVNIKRAFVRMGKKPDVRMILRSILSQVSLQEPAKDSGVTDLIRNIRTHLEQKRYFILIDDVRSESVWEVIGRAFPRCCVGSRIITTTSDKEVALACCSYVPEHKYSMEPLSVVDCEKLFIKTVGIRSVNLQLSYQVSDEINTKCGGLPLAIMWTAILVANQPEVKENLCRLEKEQGLSKMEKEENLDSHVKKFLDKNLRTDSAPVDILNHVLKLCYNSLPHYLKTCLLFLCVYPENYFFLKEDLVKLWIVEGFICPSEEDKVEAAGRYFDVFVSLGLIQRMDINCNKQHQQGELVEDEGEEYPLRVPYVVHPTVFDFITTKSTEDNFITVIDYSQSTVALKEKIHRLSLHFGSATYASTPESIGLSHIRTVSFMGLLSCMPSLVEFRLVRVLILHLWDDDGDKKFPLAEICKLFLLKYLQVRCNVTVELPCQIGCLKNLETLEINSVVTAVPSDVFHLARLLHLRLGLKQNLALNPVIAVTAICSDELLPPMDNSSSISTPSVQIFELRLPICIFSRVPKWIPQLGKLSILEIVVRELFTTDIDMLADLPALTALSLYVRMPTAGNIVFHRGAFPDLKYFRIICGVLSLDFQEETMPNLQKLNIAFNARRREKYANIFAGIQHLLKLQEVIASIGTTMGTEETDTIAAESVLKDAINKHPRPTKFNMKRVHQVEEEYHPLALDPLSLNLQEVPVIHGQQTEDSTNEQPINLVEVPAKDTHEHANIGIEDCKNLQSQVNMSISCYIKQAMDVLRSCVTFLRRLRSPRSRSNGSENQELKEDDLLKLKSSLQCLRDTLPTMRNSIDLAEWRSHEMYAAELLAEHKAAMYDAEDLLEYFRYYELKVQIEGTVTSLEPGTKFFYDAFEGNMEKLNHIKERLDNQHMQLERMGLHRATPRFDRSVRPETTSFPTEATIFGRDVETKELIRLLGVSANNRKDPYRLKRKRSAIRSSASKQVCPILYTNEATLITSVPVLPIVGIGGVGKTTLAQTICSDPHVKRHFDVIVWICVSDDFDAKRLTKEAIEQFSSKAPTTDNLNSLQVDLANIVSKKRFLIVLDDIWVENWVIWKIFYAPFKYARKGSMMLVTTRSGKVSDIVGTMNPFLLTGLRDDDFQNFFKLCALGSDSSSINPELERIGKQILPKLKGSPLAAKTLGRLVGKSLDPAHWNIILHSELWELKQESTDILPSLRLSYMYLPFHLKRCFSFCAVYPKDYMFVKEDLAEIWVAEGFVEPQCNIPLQQTACKYFEELAHMSFFQKLRGKYFINDLMHDMAQFVSKDECFIIKEKEDLQRIPQNVRHLSVLRSGDLKCSDLVSLCKQTKLRTLLCHMPLKSGDGNTVVKKWCEELFCLRVMVCDSISKWGLPDSIINMKNLRYLKIINYCLFNHIPASLCRLYNLQVLYATKCCFQKIPRGFCNLINLQKFESQSLKIHAAILENEEGTRLLKGFNLIPRDFLISNLCKISKDQAVEIELMKIEYIRSLTLKWSKGISPTHNDIEVFEALHPPTNIKIVCLECYPGEGLPSWSHGSQDPTIFSSLTEIKVIDCPRLSSLEQFLQPDYIPAIKKMEIMNCPNLESIPVERFGCLPSLRRLAVYNCPNIKSQRLLAPSLMELDLMNSGNLGDHLASLTLNMPVLERLFIRFCPRLRWGIVLPSSLVQLSLADCGITHITSISGEMWSSHLISVSIVKCQDLVSIGGPEAIAHIPSVYIRDCPKLKEIQQPLEIDHI